MLCSKFSGGGKASYRLRQVIRVLLVFLCGMLFTSSQAIQAAAKDMSPLKTSSSVRYYTLKNGLQLLVVPVNSAPVVLNSLWYKVGSSYETNGITGISHLLEHLMFAGTKKHPGAQMAKLVAAVGGTQNAFTSRDVTVYFEKLPAAFLPQALAIEADRMQNLQINTKVFANEVKVVKEERRLRVVDNPQAVTLERFMAAAHVNNPYHHPVIGWESDLDAMRLEDVQRWYRQWYQPNNALIIIVGRVKPDQVLQIVKHDFGHIPRKNLPQIKPRSEVEGLGERQINVSRPAQQPWMLMGFRAPTLVTLPKAARWRAYALTLLAGVMNAGVSGRLEKDLVDKQQIATDVDVSYNPQLLYSTLFTISATPAADSEYSEVRAAIAKQIQQLQSRLVSVKELNKVKAQVVASEVYAKDSFLQRAISYGQLLAIGLPWQDAEVYIKRINAITPAQVQAVAKTYFNFDHLTVARLLPKT